MKKAIASAELQEGFKKLAMNDLVFNGTEWGTVQGVEDDTVTVAPHIIPLGRESQEKWPKSGITVIHHHNEEGIR